MVRLVFLLWRKSIQGSSSSAFLGSGNDTISVLFLFNSDEHGRRYWISFHNYISQHWTIISSMTVFFKTPPSFPYLHQLSSLLSRRHKYLFIVFFYLLYVVILCICKGFRPGFQYFKCYVQSFYKFIIVIFSISYLFYVSQHFYCQDPRFPLYNQKGTQGVVYPIILHTYLISIDHKN